MLRRPNVPIGRPCGRTYAVARRRTAAPNAIREVSSRRYEPSTHGSLGVEVAASVVAAVVDGEGAGRSPAASSALEPSQPLASVASVRTA
jgi:hypothetical protein